MMSVREFLSDLSDLDIKLWIEEDRLKCNAPKGTLTSEIREKLTEFKADIVRFLQEGRTSLAEKSDSIKPIPRNGYIPLSFAQLRLWFLDQFEGGSATYNMPVAFKLTGSLNLGVLEQSLGAIVNRHEVLRTRFKTVNGMPVLEIEAEANLTLPVIDLSSIPVEEQTAAVQQRAEAEAKQPFDLATEPLIRGSLLKLAEDCHVLLITMHHIVSDGWSGGIFIRELSALYQAGIKGEPSPLPELAIQYGDFAHWQQQWLTGETLEQQLAYWKQQLAGIPPLLELPTDHPRPGVQSFRGSHQSFQLSQELSRQLKDLSQAQGTTLFMILISAWAVLLYRYSGQEDLTIGTPIANRNRAEIEPLIGFFVNTLVMRTDLSGNPQFSQLLQQVRQVALEGYAHQDLPFEKLVEELQPERNLSHSPLFQMMFVLQNAPMDELTLPGLTITPIKYESVIAKFDLTLSMAETESGLRGYWQYNSDLFEPETITRMMGHFQVLLEGIVANPEESISQLPILMEAERQRLLVEWNDTQAYYPGDKCIHQLFEEQVERTPDAIAVVYEEQKLTYRELNEKANQLAHYLQKLAVKPDDLVGICLERSLEMLIGLLAILKSGGAYLPLDHKLPEERLAFILEDTKTSVLFIQSHLKPLFSFYQGEIICWDEVENLLRQESRDNANTEVSLSNLMYVLFTSGSTGTPKGVAVEHKQVIHYYNSIIDRLKIKESLNFANVSTLAADLGNTVIFPAICTGGVLHVISEDRIGDPSGLAKYFSDHNIEVLKITPSHLEALMSGEQSRQIIPRCQLVLGGEASSWNLIRRIENLAPHCQIYNHYGPTETTVGVATYDLRTNRKDYDSVTVPIGTPLANNQIYILDSYLQPVPIGVSGEIHIGGEGISRGYLNRPELTAAKFITNPFSEESNSRLYKTGDLARYLPDGNIEYLGRIDHQVKIRGFRIELGEIEASLSQHPQIRKSVVIVREEQVGDKRLVAYVVTKGETPLVKELREFLQQQLPEYMVPSAFVCLEAMPLTPNGKVDRRALPTPDQIRISSVENITAPRNPLELQLVQLWSEILKVEQVGIDSNFFELGGHSLLAVQLMSNIEQKFGKKLPIAELFQNPTVEKLAVLLSEQSDDHLSWSSLVRINPAGNKPPLFSIHPAGGTVLCYFNLSLNLGTEQPFYGLQALGFDGKSQPHNKIEDMASHYIKEIRKVQAEGPYYLAGWSLGGLVAFEMAQQLTLQGSPVSFIGLIDTYNPSIRSSNENIADDDVTLLMDIFGEELNLSSGYLQQLSPNEQLLYILEKVKQQKIIPPEFDFKQGQDFLKVFRCNIAASKCYQTRLYQGKIDLFIAEETQQLIELDHLDPTLGWQQFASRGIKTHSIGGNHNTMIKKLPYVKDLARQLKIAISKS